MSVRVETVCGGMSPIPYQKRADLYSARIQGATMKSSCVLNNNASLGPVICIRRDLSGRPKKFFCTGSRHQPKHCPADVKFGHSRNIQRGSNIHHLGIESCTCLLVGDKKDKMGFHPFYSERSMSIVIRYSFAIDGCPCAIETSMPFLYVSTALSRLPVLS